jgi:hypothetical protein
VTPAPGAVVEHFSSWVDGFGFMTMERRGADQWAWKCMICKENPQPLPARRAPFGVRVAQVK